MTDNSDIPIRQLLDTYVESVARDINLRLESGEIGREGIIICQKTTTSFAYEPNGHSYQLRSDRILREQPQRKDIESYLNQNLHELPIYTQCLEEMTKAYPSASTQISMSLQSLARIAIASLVSGSLDQGILPKRIQCLLDDMNSRPCTYSITI